MPNILEKKNKLDQLENNSLEETLNLTSNSLEKNQTSSEQKPQGLINVIAQCLPFAPILFEQMTGQKIPAMTGTIADIQTALHQLTISLQQVLTNEQTIVKNQQQIFQRIVNLETNASQQILSLDKRLDTIQSIKLTHEKERQQIEYHQPSKLAETEEY